MSKQINAKIALRRDDEANYSSASIPLKGEICIIDTPTDLIRIKIGDGSTTFGLLPFIDQYNAIVYVGYYYNGIFYQDSAHTIALDKNSSKIYIENTSKYIYIYDTTNDIYININDKIPSATASAPGILKLYTGTGQNTDGTITQKAITDVTSDLQTQITNLKNIGRFLAIWDCRNGLPLTDPTVMPYTYRTGDYYRVGAVASGYHHAIVASGDTTSLGTYSGTYTFSFTLDSTTVYTELTTIESVIAAMDDTTRYTATGTLTTSDATYTITSIIKWVQDDVSYIALCDASDEKLALVLASTTQTDTVTGGNTNYKPDGSTYTGTASTIIETGDVEISWVYYYDGTSWLAQSGGGGGKIQDVYIDGTTVVEADTGIAKIEVASDTVLGVFKTSGTYATTIGEKTLQAVVKSYLEYQSLNNNAFIGKGTLENVLDAIVVRADKATSLTTAQQAQARANIGAGTPYTVTVDI